MITKDKEDNSSALQNISSKPIKGNLPEIEHLCTEEVPQGEKKLERGIVSNTTETISTRWIFGAGTVSSVNCVEPHTINLDTIFSFHSLVKLVDI